MSSSPNMESWSSTSDSEIEDVRKDQDLVNFDNIQKYYSPHSDIVAAYTIGESFTDHKRDWIGLFQSGWDDFSKHVDFQWAKLEPFSKLLPRRRRVIFEAPHSKIKNHFSTFQFLYITSGKQVAGVSNLFHILDLPRESDLNFDLLENALMDDDEEKVVVSEPFSGIKDSASTVDASPSFYLPHVANTQDSDIQNTVISLYSPTDSYNNRKLAKTELPFFKVRDQQIVEFFGPAEPQNKQKPSWLQKIFNNAQPSVEMYENATSSRHGTRSYSSQKSKQKLKVTFQDTTSLIQETYKDRSWMNDLRFVKKDKIVEDYYFNGHPFNEFANIFLNESIDEPSDFCASSVVEEFKTRMSGSFEHLDSVCSDADWHEVIETKSKPSKKATENVVKVSEPTSEASTSHSYDFSDDLDMFFHEKVDGKMNRKYKETRRPKRKNKKNRKNSRISHKPEKEQSSSGESVAPSTSPKSSNKSPQTAKTFGNRKRQQFRTELVAVPSKKAEISETGLAVVPYKPFNPVMVQQPFLSVPFLFPQIPTIPLVQFPSPCLSMPYKQQQCGPIATMSQRPYRVKVPYYTKNIQGASRSNSKPSGCISCRYNRKMAYTYKDRCSTAEKQNGMFQKEQVDLQNQMNVVKEELKDIKSQKEEESTKVHSLTTKVDDLVHIVPEVDDVIRNLNENNELLDMAFNSAIVDNSELKKELLSMKESLRTLNNQFVETASELRITIQGIEEKQQLAVQIVPQCKCDSSSLETIDRLKVIIEKREQWIVSLLLRVDSQSHEIDNKTKELSSMRELLENERQRANKAENEREELKIKIAAMVAKQATSREQKPTWSGAVTRPVKSKKPRVQFTLCNETINQSCHSKIGTNQSHSTKFSLSKSLENSRSKAEFWKQYNTELKQQIAEGLCRICGMTFSPFVDKRIIEEHITYHKQFNHFY